MDTQPQPFSIFPAKVRLEPTLVEFAQFCITFKGLGTNDCIDLQKFGINRLNTKKIDEEPAFLCKYYCHC